jgi:hypothetical protein
VQIAWGTLAGIAVVSAGAALTVVLLVSFALVGLSTSSAPGAGEGDGAGTRFAGRAVPALCLLAAGLIICYSLYLIVA